MGTPQDPPYPLPPPLFLVPDPDAPPDPDEDKPPPPPLPSLAVGTDPPHGFEPWLDRPLSADELKAARIRLAKLTDADLMRAYDAALEICRLDKGVPPRAAFIQQLVASWKEMQRRQRAKT